MPGAKSSNFVNKILSKLKGARATLNTFNAFIRSTIVSVFPKKNGFCKFTWETLDLDLKPQKCVFEV